MSTVITPEGQVFNITGGTRPDQGPNLLHSFGQFDVGTGDTAHFVGQPGIANIIGRVTGGGASHIDGHLQSDASLFLLNPNGLLFGPNATLDVNGSFHASTADALRFADGATFSAHLNEKSTLTVASPSAFGFLSENPAGIAIEGSQLEVPAGKTISLVGGDVKIMGGRSADDDPPTVFAPSGRINLVSVASPGEVVPEISVHGSPLNVESFAHFGNVTISDGSLINTSSERGGTIVIRSGNLLIENSFIFADTLGNIDGASVGVDLQVSESMVVTNNSAITADALGAGRAGDLRVNTNHLEVNNDAFIRSNTFGRGQGGNVMVRATETVHLDGTIPNGPLPSGIFANAEGQGEGAGDAGNVVVEAAQVTLTGGAAIGSSTSGLGQGGNVTVQAAETVRLDGATPNGTFFSDISANALGKGEGAGNAGSVVVEARQVTLTGGAQIGSNTFGSGQGGRVTVRAGEMVSLGSSIIFAHAEGPGEQAGAAGSVLVEAPQVTLTGGAQIASATDGGGRGAV